MKIYLSNYWKKNCICITVIVIVSVISMLLFCLWSQDEEDYILAVGTLVYVLLLCYPIFLSLKLVRYVVLEKQQIVMCSFLGKKKCEINLKEDIYYQVLTLIEGVYSKQDFIIMSNKPFTSYQSNGSIGLGKTCKLIDKNGNQIIMPYKSENIQNLSDIYTWHEILQ